MKTSDYLLAFVRQQGPILPTHAAKKINTNLLLASAHLAEMTSRGQLKVSSLKVGGSPLYYIPGQEQLLEKFHDNLSEKEKKAYEILKQRHILRDNQLEPVVRVALRSIKDFAIPLRVQHHDSKEIFWKWHGLPNQKAEELIKGHFTIQSKSPSQEKEIIKEKQKTEKKPQANQKSLVHEKEPTSKNISDSFSNTLSNFFSNREITIIEKKIIRKNSDVELFIEVPSSLGKLKYFCKAKNKKKINDADLSSAFVKGQMHKLPVILISPGELTKKAQEVLATLDGLTYTKVE